MASIPKSIFTRKLDDLVNSWLKTTHPVDERAMRRSMVLNLLDVAEALIISPRVTFKIWGENVVVPVLVDFFGVEGVEQLLEEEAIDFLLWTEDVTRFLNDPPQRGIHPLQSLVTKEDTHRDPLTSAKEGMTWHKNLADHDARRLARKVADRTRLPPVGVASTAVGAVHAAFADGRLIEFGFDPTKQPMDQLSAVEREALLHIGSDVLTATVLFHEEIDLYADEHTWHAVMTMIERLARQRGSLEAVESILKVERMPSIQQLLTRQVIKWEDIVVLRNKPETRDLRSWLWKQPDPTNAAAVTEQYLALMLSTSDRRSPLWRKVARIVSASVVGSGLGAVAAGPAGAVVGFAISTGISAGVSLVDGLVGDKLIGKVNPRRFSTDVVAAAMAAALRRTAPTSLIGMSEQRDH